MATYEGIFKSTNGGTNWTTELGGATNLDWTDEFVKNNIGIIEENYSKFPDRNRWNCIGNQRLVQQDGI